MKYKVVLSPSKSYEPIQKDDNGVFIRNTRDRTYYEIHIIDNDTIDYPDGWGYSIIYHHTLPATSGCQRGKDSKDHGWRNILYTTDKYIADSKIYRSIPLLSDAFIDHFIAMGGIEEISPEDCLPWVENNPEPIKPARKRGYHNKATGNFMGRSVHGWDDGYSLNTEAVTIALKSELVSFIYWLRNIDDGTHFYHPKLSSISDLKKNIGYSPFDEFKNGAWPEDLINAWMKYREIELDTDYGSRDQIKNKRIE